MFFFFAKVAFCFIIMLYDRLLGGKYIYPVEICLLLVENYTSQRTK